MNELIGFKTCKTCEACGKDIAIGVKKCIHCGKDQRNFFMRHKIITGLGGFFAFIIFVSVVGGSTTATNTSLKADKSTDSAIIADTEETTPAGAEKPAEVMEIISIDAKKISKEFEDNEIKANKKYKNKDVKLSGTIDSIDEMFNQTFIVLKGNSEFSLCQMQCFFEDESEIEKIVNMNKGDRVVVQGLLEGKSLNVSIKGCKFIN